MSFDAQELYREVIVDHSRRPRNRRAIESPTGHAVGHNPLCGDRVHVYVKLDNDGKIEDVSFEGGGCAISTASASIMTETMVGHTLDEAQKLFESFHERLTRNGEGPPSDELDPISAIEGVRRFPARVKCATLAWHTLKAAIDQRNGDVVKTE
ncbi:MAG: SUF system NifU family Fe-S cluster assembly protein [Phycisphaeraceae bacterium]|nr:MAG: SUF system NifU family Fe-S cluster assembly protein [Phycisphaeraceae bacterium]